MSATTTEKPPKGKGKGKTKAAKAEVDTATKDVTDVLANVDMGKALRDRIKALQDDLKVHEDKVKAFMGEAVEGVDARGNVLVRLPHRNRTNLIAKEVEKRLSAEDYADCTNVTSYRALLYGA